MTATPSMSIPKSRRAQRREPNAASHQRRDPTQRAPTARAQRSEPLTARPQRRATPTARPQRRDPNEPEAKANQAPKQDALVTAMVKRRVLDADHVARATIIAEIRENRPENAPAWSLIDPLSANIELHVCSTRSSPMTTT
jgi:hypothetical protein